MKLLKTLCEIPAPSGHEDTLTQFLLEHINTHCESWHTTPQVLSGPLLQNSIILIFGQPRTAIFAHIDSIGYMARYGKQLIPIGGPDSRTGYKLKGQDSQGDIRCQLQVGEDDKLQHDFYRQIDRGTPLVYDCNFRNDKEFVQSCYLDNRLGVWVALQIAETLKDGIICFSCWEEHGGGSVPYLAKTIYEQYHVSQALICDITWVTEGVTAGAGAAISIRDRSIPRRLFVNKIIDKVKSSGIPYQLEVEEYGGSDGKELQGSAYPFDWCFIGAPEENVHSPDEKVHKKDIDSMVAIYKYLMKEL